MYDDNFLATVAAAVREPGAADTLWPLLDGAGNFGFSRRIDAVCRVLQIPRADLVRGVWGYEPTRAGCLHDLRVLCTRASRMDWRRYGRRADEIRYHRQALREFTDPLTLPVGQRTDYRHANGVLGWLPSGREHSCLVLARLTGRLPTPA